MVVVRTPDHKAHLTVPGSPADQKSVHQGDVVGHQQSAALRGNVAPAPSTRTRYKAAIRQRTPKRTNPSGIPAVTSGITEIV